MCSRREVEIMLIYPLRHNTSVIYKEIWQLIAVMHGLGFIGKKKCIYLILHTYIPQSALLVKYFPNLWTVLIEALIK